MTCRAATHTPCTSCSTRVVPLLCMLPRLPACVRCHVNICRSQARQLRICPLLALLSGTRCGCHPRGHRGAICVHDAPPPCGRAESRTSRAARPRPQRAMPAAWRAPVTVLLLCGSNVFMTLAWYLHLKRPHWNMAQAIFLSWLIASCEYCLQARWLRWLLNSAARRLTSVCGV
jgi:hypothetical protein